jgi:hypothetical protein
MQGPAIIRKNYSINNGKIPILGIKTHYVSISLTRNYKSREFARFLPASFAPLTGYLGIEEFQHVNVLP